MGSGCTLQASSVVLSAALKGSTIIPILQRNGPRPGRLSHGPEVTQRVRPSQEQKPGLPPEPRLLSPPSCHCLKGPRVLQFHFPEVYGFSQHSQEGGGTGRWGTPTGQGLNVY